MTSEQKIVRLVLLILLVIGFLLVNEWCFSRLMAVQSTSLPPLLRSLLLLLDGFLILVISMVIRHWRRFKMTRFLLQSIALAGIFLLMELGLRVAVAVVMPDRHATTLRRKIDLRTIQPAHMGSTWPLKDAEELGPFLYRNLMDYDPYLQWQCGEFHGTYTNIDHPGFRRTWNPPPGELTDTLFVFGGSAVWGQGPGMISRFLHFYPGSLKKLVDRFMW